jgi:hypothetical protein
VDTQNQFLRLNSIAGFVIGIPGFVQQLSKQFSDFRSSSTTRMNGANTARIVSSNVFSFGTI